MVAVSAVEPSELLEIGVRTGSVLHESSGQSNAAGDVCDKTFSCASCTESRVCTQQPDGNFVEMTRTPCPDDAPYCDSNIGSCTADESLNCTDKDTITCLKDGYFPHPTTCKKFFYCHNLVSYTYNCVGSTRYDAELVKCVDKIPCHKFNCVGKDGRRVPYSSNPHFLAFCWYDAAKYVTSCDNDIDQFNETTQKCERPRSLTLTS